jgi:hypothetical protein
MSPELERFRAAFPSREAAERFVARVQGSADHDLERLAKRIVDHVDKVVDPARSADRAGARRSRA